jgi:hypothetical protein
MVEEFVDSADIKTWQIVPNFVSMPWPMGPGSDVD